MKKDIHPDYHNVTIQCACGNSFESKSTANGDVVKVELCNKCHPFYTGKQKIVDASGRVDLFKKKFGV